MMTPGRAPIPKASDVVVTSLRQKILSERLPVGAKLPSVDDLMVEHGLGRVTVREALRMLERDGLIDVRRGPAGGVFVRHTDIRQVSEALALLFSFRGTTLKEFASFRLLVEPEVARLAAINATDKEREEILHVAKTEKEAWQSANLHSLIAGCCGNDVYEFALKSMHVSLAGHFRHDLITRDNADKTAQAHTKIATCIAEGDAAGAESAMRRHLEVYQAFLMTHDLENDPIFPAG